MQEGMSLRQKHRAMQTLLCVREEQQAPCGRKSVALEGTVGLLRNWDILRF